MIPLSQKPFLNVHRKWSQNIPKLRDFDMDFLEVVTKTLAWSTCAAAGAGPLSNLLRNFTGPTVLFAMHTQYACFEQFAIAINANAYSPGAAIE